MLKLHISQYRKKITRFPHKNRYLVINRKHGSLYLTSKYGFVIMWNGESFIEIKISSTYKNYVCGLCGLYD